MHAADTLAGTVLLATWALLVWGWFKSALDDDGKGRRR